MRIAFADTLHAHTHIYARASSACLCLAVCDVCVMQCLHNEANMKQTWSTRRASAYSIHLLHVCFIMKTPYKNPKYAVVKISKILIVGCYIAISGVL